MKEQVRQQLDQAIAGIRSQNQEPSQLMLDIQKVLNEPEAPGTPQTDAQPAKAGEGLIDPARPNLEKAIQRLMNCNPTEARRYINVVVRGDALAGEMAAEGNG